MAHFPDLSAYSYAASDIPMLNVGWLDGHHDYPRGDVDPAVLQRLLRLAESPPSIMRGVHDCELCDLESPIRLPAPSSRGYVSLGTGEIHVPGPSGTVFAAPTLLIHYIADHQYLPPQPFLDALAAEDETP